MLQSVFLLKTETILRKVLTFLWYVYDRRILLFGIISILLLLRKNNSKCWILLSKNKFVYTLIHSFSFRLWISSALGAFLVSTLSVQRNTYKLFCMQHNVYNFSKCFPYNGRKMCTTIKVVNRLSYCLLKMSECFT